MKRGRPKGSSKDTRSFGPVGDLIRKARLGKSLGLADVAKSCGCSVQFISNIEHGRAPLPWDKAPLLAKALELSLEDLQAANLAIRADLKGFVAGTSKKVSKPLILKKAAERATAIALAAKDSQLQELIQKYHAASSASRKKFVKAALEILAS